MDLETAMRSSPGTLTFERMLIGWVLRNPGDWSGAIRTLPPNLQMMFVHAYQSYLFNLILSERIRRGIPLDRPIVGDVVLPADRSGYADHDKPVPVTKFNLDLVEKSVSEHKAFVSAVLFGSESKFAEGEMGEIERKVVTAEGVGLPRTSSFPRSPSAIPEAHAGSFLPRSGTSSWIAPRTAWTWRSPSVRGATPRSCCASS